MGTMGRQPVSQDSFPVSLSMHGRFLHLKTWLAHQRPIFPALGKFI